MAILTFILQFSVPFDQIPGHNQSFKQTLCVGRIGQQNTLRYLHKERHANDGYKNVIFRISTNEPQARARFRQGQELQITENAAGAKPQKGVHKVYRLQPWQLRENTDLDRF